MPFNYGGRNGVSQIIRYTKFVCRIYLTYATRIIAYVESSSLDSGKKATVTAWLAGAQDACMILEEIQISYEQ